MGNGMNKQLLLECVRAYICDLYDEMQHGYCTDADPADYWRAMLKDYISKQPLHKLISRKEFFALVDARDYVPEPLHSALYRICEKYESEE